MYYFTHIRMHVHQQNMRIFLHNSFPNGLHVIHGSIVGQMRHDS